jgi:plastocyanin
VGRETLEGASRYRLRAALVAGAAFAALAIGAAPAGAATPRVSVVGTEFKFTPARPVVRPGLTMVQLVNKGEERHNLLLQKLNAQGKGVGPFVLIGPIGGGQKAQKAVRFKLGRYSMVCTIDDHAEKGMKGRITVRA